MAQTEGEYVVSALAEMAAVLEPAAAADWTTRAGPLEWTCWKTAAHLAHDLIAYAGQVAASPTGSYLPCDLVVRRHATPTEVLTVVRACGTLLVGALRQAGPDTKAWHYGMADPTGFEAMAVGEIILHTHDIVTGLDVRYQPPEPLCALVLERLFPEAPRGDPVKVLLWATGRGQLEGHPPVTAWVWRAAVR